MAPLVEQSRWQCLQNTGLSHLALSPPNLSSALRVRVIKKDGVDGYTKHVWLLVPLAAIDQMDSWLTYILFVPFAYFDIVRLFSDHVHLFSWCFVDFIRLVHFICVSKLFLSYMYFSWPIFVFFVLLRNCLHVHHCISNHLFHFRTSKLND
jgi:hypothetical protein